MAYEDRRQPAERVGEHGRDLTPDRTSGQVTQQRIRENAHAVEVDQDGRMAEKGQPIAQTNPPTSTMGRESGPSDMRSC
jgi:hypothetical protein